MTIVTISLGFLNDMLCAYCATTGTFKAVFSFQIICQDETIDLKIITVPNEGKSNLENTKPQRTGSSIVDLFT